MSRSDTENWYTSALNNFKRIRSRHAKSDPCSLIEHYTDVVAEATTAAAIGHNIESDIPGVERFAKAADQLTSTATRAQRGAVKACSLGIRRRG